MCVLWMVVGGYSYDECYHVVVYVLDFYLHVYEYDTIQEVGVCWVV